MLPALPFDAAQVHVVVMPNRDMEPAVPRGSLVFLGPAGYAGEVLYSLPDNRTNRPGPYPHRGEIRRLNMMAHPTLCTFTADNEPAYQSLYVKGPSTFERADIRPVLGVLAPHDAGFGTWLRERFQSVPV